MTERRMFAGEVRSTGDGKAFEGYAARFNDRTYIGPEGRGFYEEIAPGAFVDVIAAEDTRSLFNHAVDNLLGRVSSGTLRLQEDGQGLLVNNDLPETNLGRDLSVLVQRRDITGMSFSFDVAPGGDVWSVLDDGSRLRRITRFSKLYDVGPVTFPAYETTTASVRTALRDGRDATEPARRAARRSAGQEKRGLVVAVQATDAAVDAAGDAVTAGNVAQALALLQAAAAAINEADWYLWGTDPELLEALGCPEVDEALVEAWNAIYDGIAACQSAGADGVVSIDAAIAATDALLAALRLPDADDPATSVAAEEEATELDDDQRAAGIAATELRRQWLESTAVLINA